MKMKAGREPASMNAASQMLMNPRLARIIPDRFTLFLIAVAVLGAGLVLARQVTYGVSLHSDSVQYLSAAQGLLAGDGLINAAGAPFEWWPPLFPMLLAASSLGIFAPLDVAGPLNAICFGLTVLVVGHWLRRHLRSRFLVVWGCLAIALAVPVAWAASWAMSEATFILFTTLALSLTSFFLREPKRSTLLWAAVFTALACLTRYVGVAIVATVIVMLLAQHRTTLTGKAKNILGYGLVSSLPIALFLARNYIATGYLNTARQDVSYSLAEIVERSAVFLGGWIGLYETGESIDETIRIILAVIFVIFIGIFGILFQRNPDERDRWYYLYPFLLFVPFLYAIVIISLFRGQSHHGIQERYLIPAYVMMITVLLAITDGIVHTREKRIPRVIQRIISINEMKPISISLFLVLFSWIGYEVYVNQEIIRRVNSPDHRWGYQSAQYTESEVLEFVNQIPQRSFFTNYHAETIFFHTDKYQYYRVIPQSYTGAKSLISREHGGYIVYSFDPDVPTEYTAYDLLDTEGLDFVKKLADGIVLRISGRTHAEKYADITSRDPEDLSKYNVYLLGRNLSYIKEPCLPSETLEPFFLHVTPRNIANLPEHRRRAGFENLDFEFRIPGVIFDGKCMATIPLPDYQITSISTGQSSESGHIIWESRIQPALDTARLQEEYDTITSSTPVAHSFYSLWLDGPFLSYTREPCEESDTLAHFFIHVVPRNVDDLPDERKQYGFDNLDFTFGPETGSVRFDGKCIATRMLPEYPIDSVRTGQTEDGDLWSVEFTPQ